VILILARIVNIIVLKNLSSKQNMTRKIFSDLLERLLEEEPYLGKTSV
jgi:hypothetical protein